MKIKSIRKDSPHMITTWQSVVDNPQSWFNKFDVIIGDECLHPDTEISTDSGTKRIEDITPNDLVLTINEKTKSFEYKPVIKVHKNISVSEQMFEIELEDGSKLKITGNHKVMLTDGQWKRVDQLNKIS